MLIFGIDCRHFFGEMPNFGIDSGHFLGELPIFDIDCGHFFGEIPIYGIDSGHFFREMPNFGIDCGHFFGKTPIFTSNGKVYPADSRERIVFLMIKATTCEWLYLSRVIPYKLSIYISINPKPHPFKGTRISC